MRDTALQGEPIIAAGCGYPHDMRHCCSARREIHTHTRAHMVGQPISLDSAEGVTLFVYIHTVQYEVNGLGLAVVMYVRAVHRRLGNTLIIVEQIGRILAVVSYSKVVN